MFDKILNLIFPKKCIFCNRIIEDYACKMCKKNIEYICTSNKMQIVKNKYFDYIISAYKYEGIIREKILEFKFRNKKFLYEGLSEKLIENIEPCKEYIDYIISVPISFKRYIERGYNQSSLIAKKISKKLNIKKLNFTLIKIRNNSKQSVLTLDKRELNVKNVYKIINEKVLYNKNILLIDDIYTTGATVNECSKLLKEVGVNKIIVAVVAKTQKIKD